MKKLYTLLLFMPFLTVEAVDWSSPKSSGIGVSVGYSHGKGSLRNSDTYYFKKDPQSIGTIHDDSARVGSYMGSVFLNMRQRTGRQYFVTELSAGYDNAKPKVGELHATRDYNNEIVKGERYDIVYNPTLLLGGAIRLGHYFTNNLAAFTRTGLEYRLSSFDIRSSKEKYLRESFQSMHAVMGLGFEGRLSSTSYWTLMTNYKMLFYSKAVKGGSLRFQKKPNDVSFSFGIGHLF